MTSGTCSAFSDRGVAATQVARVTCGSLAAQPRER